MNVPIALYVHIPFCETKCGYCDFNTYAGIEQFIPEYVLALRREINVWGSLLGRPMVDTVFFGGGTPSYLPAEDIVLLMETVKEAFVLDCGSEVTIEANPGDVTDAKMTAYLGAGINRLSIGVQSFDDRLLNVLGRRHSAIEAVRSVRTAVRAGFHNLSIDLMYGLPSQGIGDWNKTLSEAVGLEPQHISMYCLTLEPGTPMDHWVSSGRMPNPDEDLAADMYMVAQEQMESLGYRHYEISNWAYPGKESRHNLVYWRNQCYLGVGPGAHSYLSGYRFHNIKSPKEHIRRLRDSTVPLTITRDVKKVLDAQDIKSIPVVESIELIDRRLEMAETMMLGLRLDIGVGVNDFVNRFGEMPARVYGETIDELEANGLLDTISGTIKLTDRGRLLGNEVFGKFFEHANTMGAA